MVTEVQCSYMQLKIQPHATKTQLQLRNSMINFIKVLLQFGSFKNTFFENSVELHNIKPNLKKKF